MLTAKEPKIKYMNIKNGKISLKYEGRETLYDSFEGELLDITTPTIKINGKDIKLWNFKFDGGNGETYILSINYHTGTAKALLNSLASAESYKKIKILPYEKDGFTKIIVYSNGNKLAWKYETMPPIEFVEIGGTKIPDDSKRMEFFETIRREIIYKLILEKEAENEHTTQTTN